MRGKQRDTRDIDGLAGSRADVFPPGLRQLDAGGPDDTDPDKVIPGTTAFTGCR